MKFRTTKNLVTKLIIFCVLALAPMSCDDNYLDLISAAGGGSPTPAVEEPYDFILAGFDSVLIWGIYGSGDGQFEYPEGVAVDSSGNVYVADIGREAASGNYRIQKFDSSGNFILKWGSYGSGDGQFVGWGGAVAIDSSGNVYVANGGNERIQKFDSSGTFLGWWGKDELGWTGWHDPGSGRVGEWGIGDGQFDNPMGVAVDSSGYVYVADGGNERIQKFDSSGTFLGWWGKDELGWTGWHDPGSGRVGEWGIGDGQFDNPMGVAVDSSGYVYVADTDNNRIQKFDSSGNFILKWGSYGSGDGQFSNPRGIAMDSAGNVYVAEGVSTWQEGDGNNRIQKFDSLGNFICKWGSWGSGDGQFVYPAGVTVDFSGNVYVVDYWNDRIQKFVK